MVCFLCMVGVGGGSVAERRVRGLTRVYYSRPDVREVCVGGVGFIICVLFVHGVESGE